MFFFALSTIAFAFPDAYFFNNFLAGQSPYYYTGSADNTGTFYYPNLGKENMNEGIVTSFSTQFMNGSSDNTYVESLDLDYTIGQIFEIPSNHCLVVYSGSGQYLNLNFTGDIYFSYLGETSPSTQNINNTDKTRNVLYSSSSLSSLVSNWNVTDVVNGSDTFIPGQTFYENKVNWSIPLSASNTNVLGTNVVFLVNLSDTSTYFSVSEDLTSVTSFTYDVITTPVDKVSFMVFGSIRKVSGSGVSSFKPSPYFILPHIKGDIDIYSNLYSISNAKDFINYRLETYFNINCSISSTEGNVMFFSKDYADTNNSILMTVNSAFINPDNSLMPIFLNSSSLRYLFDKAIFIKDGYININNYDELIQKLKEAGFGSGGGGSSADLERIISLLDEINTGGLTGENAKSLIDALEQSHQPIVDNGNTGWNSTKQMFEAFKQLFDFSGSSLHWIVVANNSLFNIFSGIIMMSCVFLVFSRVFKS